MVFHYFHRFCIYFKSLSLVFLEFHVFDFHIFSRYSSISIHNKSSWNEYDERLGLVMFSSFIQVGILGKYRAGLVWTPARQFQAGQADKAGIRKLFKLFLDFSH